jgi:riboflavin transporter FmnP
VRFLTHQPVARCAHLGSIKASLTCSTLNDVFFVPVYVSAQRRPVKQVASRYRLTRFEAMRLTAMIFCSSLRNRADAGESGRKKNK